MNELPDELREATIDLLLSVADDKLMLGHRGSDWTGLAPILEEDIAFSSMAQDEIAHASALYALIGEATGQDPDHIAYGRKPEEYRCAALVEFDDEFDWACALARKFFCDHFDWLRLQRLASSSWQPLAALARRQHAEEQIHVQHGNAWMVRLGRGGRESHDRLQRALDSTGALAATLFETTPGEGRVEAAGVYPALERALFDLWKASVSDVLLRADLHCEFEGALPQHPGGRRGKHGPAFAALLDEMCEVYRVEPDATW